MSIIYLFTSDYGVYFKDVLNILALPNGMTYRFRYDYKYIPLSLQENDNLLRLKGTEGICALKVKVGSEEKCIPLRKIRIISVEPYEQSFVHFLYELRDIPVVHNTLIQNFSAFTKDVLQLGKDSWVTTADKSFPLEPSISSTQNWHHLVEQLSKYGKFRNCFFVKLHSIYDQNLGSDTPIEKGRYQLTSGHNYILQYLHSLELPEEEKEKNEFQDKLAKLRLEAKLSFSEKSFLPVLTSRRIEGRYDLDFHYFYCPRTLRPEPSVIILGGDANEGFQFPRLEVPVFIKASWTRDRIILLVLGIGLLLGGIIDICLQVLDTSTIVALPEPFSSVLQVLKNVGFLGPILALVGLIMTMIQNFPSD